MGFPQDEQLPDDQPDFNSNLGLALDQDNTGGSLQPYYNYPHADSRFPNMSSDFRTQQLAFSLLGGHYMGQSQGYNQQQQWTRPYHSGPPTNPPSALAPSALPTQAAGRRAPQPANDATRVNHYLRDGRGHHGRIQDDEDFKRLTAAYMVRKNNPATYDAGDDDYPKDTAGRNELTRRLHEAMEDLTCVGPSPGRGLDIARNRINATASFEFELIAYGLVNKIRDADLGVANILGYCKVKDPSKKNLEQYDSFMARFEKAVYSLRDNKFLVVRLLDADFGKRLANDPLAESKQTKDNDAVNKMKKNRLEKLKAQAAVRDASQQASASPSPAVQLAPSTPAGGPLSQASTLGLVDGTSNQAGGSVEKRRPAKRSRYAHESDDDDGE